MCKLSQNIVPNVYTSLQSSFLSLAWPWPGRSLPKGNQWECWDPGLGPNVVWLPVHLPPPMYPLHPSALLTPLCSYTPAGLSNYTPCQPPMHPWHPYTPSQPPIPLTPPIPRSPWCHLYPCWPLSTFTPCQPWNALLTPLHSLTAPTTPDTPKSPQCHLYPCWHLSMYTPCKPPMYPWHSLMTPNTCLTPLHP